MTVYATWMSEIDAEGKLVTPENELLSQNLSYEIVFSYNLPEGRVELVRIDGGMPINIFSCNFQTITKEEAIQLVTENYTEIDNSLDLDPAIKANSSLESLTQRIFE